MAYSDISTDPSQYVYDGKGYLDGKIQPVNTVDDLNDIPKSHRFIGLTVLVLDEGCEYMVNSTRGTWVKKDYYSKTAEEAMSKINDKTDVIDELVTTVSGLTETVLEISLSIDGDDVE